MNETSLYAVATLGPDEQPNKKTVVEILRQSETKDFFMCLTEDRTLLKIHIQKLQLIWKP